MRRRRDEMDEGLDSFLDIVTNVIGLMILIAAAIVLHAQEITVSLGAPVLRSAPEGARAVYFDCHTRRVYPREADRLIEKTHAMLNGRYRHLSGMPTADEAIRWLNQRGTMPTVEENVRWLNQRGIDTRHYNATFVVTKHGHTYGIDALLEPKADNGGDTLKELVDGSEFEQLLKSLNPEKQYIYFIVRDDSFGVFRNARRIARRHGFRVGWMPIRKDAALRHIIFGPVGWGGEVQ